MAEILNLRAARKRKDRADKAAVAAERRTRFGEPKAARDTRRREKEDAAAKLDAHKRQP